MQPIIKNLEEMTDSKELYESRPTHFVGIFIYMILMGLIATFVWMYFGEIDMFSKGRGVIRPNENVSAIRSNAQGKVVETYMAEGKEVKAGEVLCILDTAQLEIQQLQKSEALEESRQQLAQITKLKESIEQGKNLFSKEKEQEYYDRYVKYMQDYEALKNNIIISSRNDALTNYETKVSWQIYDRQIQEMDEEIKEMETFRASLEKEKSLFGEKNTIYSLKFEKYLLEVQGLEKQIEENQKAYEYQKALDEEDLGARQQLEEAKNALLSAENDLKSLQAAAKQETESQITQLKSNRLKAQQEKEKLVMDETLNATKEENRKLSIEQYQTDTLVDLYNQITELKASCKSLVSQVESLKLSMENCTIKAPIDGKINLAKNIAIGDLLLEGDDLATIIPKEDQIYRVEIFIPNSEIAGLKEGQNIKYRFDALPYKEYGYLEGSIANISTDATVQNGISGYMVTGTLLNQEVYSYKGEGAQLKVGMSCEAHVITSQKKILYYLLEKINLL